MLVLISDANILIDMEDGNLTPAIFRLPLEIAVPNILMFALLGLPLVFAYGFWVYRIFRGCPIINFRVIGEKRFRFLGFSRDRYCINTCERKSSIR
jgi:hypothetical protein